MHNLFIMRNRPLLLIIIAFFFVSGLQAQWEQAGPTGGRITALHYVGDDIWAGTADGLFVSADHGESWERSSQFPKHRVFKEITTIGSDLFLVSSDRVDEHMTVEREEVFIHRSSDGGITFTTTTVQLITSDLHVTAYSLVLRLYDLGGRIFLSYWDNGYVSDDNGITWTPYLTPPVGVADMLSPLVALDSSLLYLDRFGSLFSSLDTGATWDQVQTGSGFRPFHISGDTLFRGGGSSPIEYSTDLGLNWISTNHVASGSQPFNNAKAFQDSRGYRLLGYPVAKVFLGIDTVGVEIDLSDLGAIFCFLVTKEGKVLIGDIHGLHEYEVGQSTPIDKSSFLRAAHFSYLDVSPSGDLFRFYDYSLYKSTNQGETWSKLLTDIRLFTGREPFMIWNSETTDTFSIINGIQHSISTTDGGMTFDSLEFTSPAKYLVTDIDGGEELYCHDGDSIWHTNNLGETWENVGPFPEIEGIRYLDGVLIGKYFDIVCAGGEVYLTRDEGQHWETTSISDIMSPSVGIYRAARLFSFPEGELITGSNWNWFLSTDTGSTWTTFQPVGFIPDVHVENMFLIDGVYYAHVPLNGFFTSENLEGPWEPFDDGLGSKRSRFAVKSHDDILYLYTINSSLWRYRTETSRVEEYVDQGFPLSLKLFPNPTASSVTVELLQTLTSILEVEVFDLSGRLQFRQALNFVDGRSQLDLSTLRSGAYRIHVHTSDGGFSGPVLVVK